MRAATSALRLMGCAGLALTALAGAPAMAQNRNCVDTIAGLDGASRFAAVLSRSHVAEDLRQAGPFTIFVPTDAAINAVPAALAERAFPMVSGSREIDPVLAPAAVNAHIIEGRYGSAELPPGQSKSGRTRAGNQISFVNQGGTVKVTGAGGTTATVVKADVACSNGVIHIVDHVLFR